MTREAAGKQTRTVCQHLTEIRKKIDSLNKLQDKEQKGNKKSNRTDRMRDKQIVLVHSMNREQDRTPGSFAAWNPVRGPKKEP